MDSDIAYVNRAKCYEKFERTTQAISDYKSAIDVRILVKGYNDNYAAESALRRLDVSYTPPSQQEMQNRQNAGSDGVVREGNWKNGELIDS